MADRSAYLLWATRSGRKLWSGLPFWFSTRPVEAQSLFGFLAFEAMDYDVIALCKRKPWAYDYHYEKWVRG